MNKDLEKLTNMFVEFRNDRDWKQFHTIKNLAMSLSIESAELLELFQWKNDTEIANFINSEKKYLLEDEAADVAAYLLLLCHRKKPPGETWHSGIICSLININLLFGFIINFDAIATTSAHSRCLAYIDVSSEQEPFSTVFMHSPGINSTIQSIGVYCTNNESYSSQKVFIILVYHVIIINNVSTNKLSYFAVKSTAFVLKIMDAYTYKEVNKWLKSIRKILKS